MKTAISKRYVISVFLITGMILLSTFSINAFVDPLWYFKGNVITSQNFAFNERTSKVNRFLKNSGKYDCFIFGSSRTTLLNENRISGFNCYNFSFSGGRVGEFIKYGEYLKKKGFEPQLLLVGIDGFNFFLDELEINVPDYISSGKNPPTALKNYLTIDALKFSKRTLLGESNLPRYYKKNFTGDILKGRELYRQKNDIPEYYNPTYNKGEPEYNRKSLKLYNELFRLFPKTKAIAYVPPISIRRVLKYRNDNLLEYYLDGMYSITKMGATLYDFSIPSYVTMDKSRTYDGSHYSVETNNMIAKAINDGNERFGVHVNRHTFQNYKKLFFGALKMQMTLLQ